MTDTLLKTWLITDTHFFHDKLIELNGRPSNFHDRIIKNWKRLVRPQDRVIHLGDVILGTNEKPSLRPVLEDLPGTKILVMGNHDKQSVTWYMRNGFAFACESLVFKNVLFTHKPAQSLPIGIEWNVHGHFHNNNHRRFEVPVHSWNRLLVSSIPDTSS